MSTVKKRMKNTLEMHKTLIVRGVGTTMWNNIRVWAHSGGVATPVIGWEQATAPWEEEMI